MALVMDKDGYLNKPKSACCNAEIETKINFDLVFSHNKDCCALCQNPIEYALLDLYWASREACGVFKDFDGKYWFYWQIINSWNEVVELTRKGQIYLGQVKSVVDTIGLQYNTQSVDFLSLKKHQKFLKNYINKVENPEVAELMGVCS